MTTTTDVSRTADHVTTVNAVGQMVTTGTGHLVVTEEINQEAETMSGDVTHRTLVLVMMTTGVTHLKAAPVMRMQLLQEEVFTTAAVLHQTVAADQFPVKASDDLAVLLLTEYGIS